MRTTKDLRDKMVAAAAASGRSLVQEVEYRMEASFSNEQKEELTHQVLMDNIYDQFEGRANYDLMKLMARTLVYVENETRKLWLNDKETYDQVCVALAGILRRYGPERDHPTKPAVDPTQLGEKIAGTVVELLEGTRTRALLEERGNPKASSKTLEK